MDIQAVGVGVGAVLTALATLIGGVYTGRNSKRKDEATAQTSLEQARLARDQAEEDASRQRVEALAEDLAACRRAAELLRTRRHELEDDFDQRYDILRQHAQRGWDLASYHFGLVSVLAHLLNNIFTVVEMGATPEQVVGVVKNARVRMTNVTLPVSLEDPIPESRK